MIQKLTEYILKAQDNDKDWNMYIHRFDWNPGVALHALSEASRKTGDLATDAFLRTWFEKNGKDALMQKTVNSTAPFIALVEYAEENSVYMDMCKEMAAYLLHEAPKTDIGSLEHTVTEPVPGFTQQMWADTCFMACIFMTKLGILLDRQEYRDFAAEQLYLHHKYLQDTSSHLYFHAYSCENKNHLSAVRWGRANAWVLYSSMLLLRLMPDMKYADEIKAYVSHHIEALLAVQRENGGFGTVLDEEDSYIETSATAGFAAGMFMAEKAGLAGSEAKTAAEKALAYVISQIDDDGAVQGVSGGTPVLDSAEIYKSVPCQPTLYGQALAILALCEKGA